MRNACFLLDSLAGAKIPPAYFKRVSTEPETLTFSAKSSAFRIGFGRMEWKMTYRYPYTDKH